MLGVEGEGNDEFVERQGGLRVWRRGKVMGFWSGVEERLEADLIGAVVGNWRA